MKYNWKLWRKKGTKNLIRAKFTKNKNVFHYGVRGRHLNRPRRTCFRNSRCSDPVVDKMEHRPFPPRSRSQRCAQRGGRSGRNRSISRSGRLAALFTRVVAPTRCTRTVPVPSVSAGRWWVCTERLGLPVWAQRKKRKNQLEFSQRREPPVMGGRSRGRFAGPGILSRFSTRGSGLRLDLPADNVVRRS